MLHPFLPLLMLMLCVTKERSGWARGLEALAYGDGQCPWGCRGGSDACFVEYAPAPLLIHELRRAINSGWNTRS